MSVEKKIKQLLEGKTESTEQLTEAGQVAAATKAAAATTKDNSASAKTAVAGDVTQPMQGSSEKASFETRDEDEENPGAKVSASISNQASTIATKGDAKTVKTPAMESAEDESKDTLVERGDIQTQLNSIFGEDLSEDFKSKATSIFEAAVIARVNSEMDKVVAKLEEQNVVQLQEYKDTLVEKVDSYLSYVAQQWIEENQIAIDNGLRNEITEEFISGLKNLFKENYIEVPEEKYDVIGDLTSKVETLTVQLDESISDNVDITKQLVEAKKQLVIKEESAELASTEKEKLVKLVEGIEFETEELFREKISVIKENYFPKESKSTEQVLTEQSDDKPAFVEDSVMSKYIQAISRTAKTR